MDQAIWLNHDGAFVLRCNGCEILVSRPELESLLHRIPVALQCGESLSPEYLALNYEPGSPPKAGRERSGRAQREMKREMSLDEILDFDDNRGYATVDFQGGFA